jgi:lipid A ethanolaminephosphotransferase
VRRILDREVSSGSLILIVALFVTATANVGFFASAVAAMGNEPAMWLFHISLFASVAAIIFLLLSAVCHRALVKPILITIAVLSSGLSYFAHTYGTVFDEQMIANSLQTDSAEASDLLTPALVLWVGLLGVLPAVSIWRTRLVFPHWKVETRARLKLAGVALAVLIVSLGSFSGHYAGLLRQHREVTSQAIPTYALVSAVKHFAHANATAKTGHTIVASDAALPARDPDRELIIMVVGETARADHWGLNGYARDTTPELRKKSVINFPVFWSCGTSTAISVPCMFSDRGQMGFDSATATSRDNALDILARAGVSVLWRDNNSSSKGVADRVIYENFRSPPINKLCENGECRDEGMLEGLQAWIDQQKGDALIVLHQMGNHGPAYYKRYPKAFERFTPVCASSDLGTCQTEEINNAYDNAILYTDHFLAKVIDLLKANDKTHETAMLYVSDHGESLGEYGLYLHGAPYTFAPESQRHVPAVMWLGEGIAEDVVMSTVAERSRRRWSHDNVFATLLGFFEIHSGTYKPEMDILERTHDETTVERSGVR